MEEEGTRPKIDGVNFKHISCDDNLMLILAFKEDEMKEVIWDCGSDKSPSPDGFSFCFLRVLGYGERR